MITHFFNQVPLLVEFMSLDNWRVIRPEVDPLCSNFRVRILSAWRKELEREIAVLKDEARAAEKEIVKLAGAVALGEIVLRSLFGAVGESR
jgi:hypothetical protein